MLDEGFFVTEAEYRKQKIQPLRFGSSTKDDEDADSDGHVTSWYVDAIIEDVIHALMKEKEVSYDTAETLLYSAGYKIYACIDMGVQDIIDQVYSTVDNIPSGYVKSSSQDLQSSIVVMDCRPRTACCSRGAGTGSRNRRTA